MGGAAGGFGVVLRVPCFVLREYVVRGGSGSPKPKVQRPKSAGSGGHPKGWTPNGERTGAPGMGEFNLIEVV